MKKRQFKCCCCEAPDGVCQDCTWVPTCFETEIFEYEIAGLSVADNCMTCSKQERCLKFYYFSLYKKGKVDKHADPI